MPSPHCEAETPIFSVTVDPMARTFSMGRDRWSLLFSVACLCLCAAFLWMFLAETFPTVGGVRYHYDNQPEQVGRFPLNIDTAGKQLDIRFPLVLGFFHPRVYHLVPDDCVESMDINGKKVDADFFPLCDYTLGRHVNLGPWLQQGVNDVHMVVNDAGGRGGLFFDVSTRDPLVLLIAIIAVIIFFWYGYQILNALGADKTMHLLFLLLGAGILLRFGYVLITPYGVRAHDVDGHIDYVRFIVQHLRLPDPHEGWQSYQPPLYYALGALFVTVFGFFQDTAVLQGLGFLLSVGTLIVSLFIARELFATDEAEPRFLYIALLVSFPGLVYFASRINNDVLACFLGAIGILFLLRFLQRGAVARDWYIAIVAIALGILAKATVGLLLPVALLVLCITPFKRKSVVRRLSLGLVAGLIGLLLCGWFFIPRTIAEHGQKSAIVGNIGALNSALILRNSWSSYLTFNPKEILAHPFNNAWDDAARRQQFPEYFFKSAFFGEFGFNASLIPLAKLVLLVWLLLLPVTVLGMIMGLVRPTRTSATLVFMMLCLLLGHAVFRYGFPYASSQDFRYNILLLFPWLYFVIRGRDACPIALREVATALITGAATLGVIWCIALSFF